MTRERQQRLAAAFFSLAIFVVAMLWSPSGEGSDVSGEIAGGDSSSVVIFNYADEALDAPAEQGIEHIN
jgi:hypothetical protein